MIDSCGTAHYYSVHVLPIHKPAWVGRVVDETEVRVNNGRYVFNRNILRSWDRIRTSLVRVQLITTYVGMLLLRIRQLDCQNEQLKKEVNLTYVQGPAFDKFFFHHRCYNNRYILVRV